MGSSVRETLQMEFPEKVTVLRKDIAVLFAKNCIDAHFGWAYFTKALTKQSSIYILKFCSQVPYCEGLYDVYLLW